MRVPVVLLEDPARAHELSGASHPRERFAGVPVVVEGAPVRLLTHDAEPVGRLVESWHDEQSGVLFGVADIWDEFATEARAALGSSLSGSVEFTRGPDSRWRDDEGLSGCYLNGWGTVVNGLALGVSDPCRSDTRALAVPAPVVSPVARELVQVRSAGGGDLGRVLARYVGRDGKPITQHRPGGTLVRRSW